MQGSAVRATVGDRDLPTWAFRRVERELYEYPLAKKAVEEYEQDRLNILLSSPSPEIRVDGGCLPDPTQKTATLLAMRHQIYLRRKRIVEAIEDVFQHLSADDQDLVRLRYWEHPGWDVETVARELVISRAEFYRRRKDVLRQFAVRMGFV